MISYSEALETAKIKVSSRKHLLRMSNVQWRGGRLHDATCHYQHQVTISGETYALRDVFKAWGFRWDSSHSVWFKKVANTIGEDVAATRVAVARRVAPQDQLVSDLEKSMCQVREVVQEHYMSAQPRPHWCFEEGCGGPDDWSDHTLLEYFSECELSLDAEEDSPQEFDEMEAELEAVAG